MAKRDGKTDFEAARHLDVADLKVVRDVLLGLARILTPAERRKFRCPDGLKAIECVIEFRASAGNPPVIPTSELGSNPKLAGRRFRALRRLIEVAVDRGRLRGTAVESRRGWVRVVWTGFGQQPDGLDPTRLRAIVANQRGQADKTDALIAKILASVPDDPFTLNLHGQRLMDESRFDDARGAFERVRDTPGISKGLRHAAIANLGASERMRGDVEAALGFYLEARRLAAQYAGHSSARRPRRIDRSDIEDWSRNLLVDEINLAEVRLHTGPDAAIRECTRILPSARKYRELRANTLHLRGLAHRYSGNLPRATVDLLAAKIAYRAARRSRGILRVRSELGIIARELGRHSAARRTQTEVLEGARKARYTEAVALALINLAEIELDKGFAVRAGQKLDAALKELSAMKHPHPAAFALAYWTLARTSGSPRNRTAALARVAECLHESDEDAQRDLESAQRDSMSEMKAEAAYRWKLTRLWMAGMHW